MRKKRPKPCFEQAAVTCLSEADLKPSDKVDAAFSCQGTNRKVDLEYMTKFTEGSKAAGVLYMDRLRSQGANKDS
ncbi:hypothetical protein PC114_g20072 [Phytophthora cactorum]|uniref:Uncharacterized protein n=1 Tax=Phytophthora cactorum TaxID=29920 RepID=A0A8T1CLR9_9STRA|nr:hypothetical protein PC114_g20072 [Phytophthora cactorum]KAG2924361.1 hypothetical protein PC115_g8647 [Phytophthora cactorum]KAG3049155.1 hypothetical protein PC121_g19057 [Phytophthora cactorum]